MEIDCEGMVGRIVGFAHYVSKLKKSTTTYLSIAASPLEFGSFGKIDLASMEFIQGI
jgi:hypothetical protein